MIRSVVVGTAADRDRQAVSPVVSQDEQVSSGFGGTVRAACVDRGFFREEKIRSVQRKIAVNFIGGNLMIAGDTVFAAGIHQDSRSFNIGIEENFRVFDGTVYMAFRSKVDDHIRMFFFK